MSSNTGETGEEAQHGSLRQALALLFQRAATIVVRTDVFIVLTGAGWLADSGLAAYKDVAEVPAYTRLGKTCLDLCASEQLLGDDAIEVSCGHSGSRDCWLARDFHASLLRIRAPPVEFLSTRILQRVRLY